MAATLEDRSFAALAGGRRFGRCAIKSNTEKKTLDDYQWRNIEDVNWEVRIIPPEKYTENIRRRTVIFKCRKDESKKISNPPMRSSCLTSISEWMRWSSTQVLLKLPGVRGIFQWRNCICSIYCHSRIPGIDILPDIHGKNVNENQSRVYTPMHKDRMDYHNNS